eukprot:m.201202 g.201202  ORF g.201202 m.201202 type:complete len:320 (+) comp15501_c0_seq2:814-1773(+)
MVVTLPAWSPPPSSPVARIPSLRPPRALRPLHCWDRELLRVPPLAPLLSLSSVKPPTPCLPTSGRANWAYGQPQQNCTSLHILPSCRRTFARLSSSPRVCFASVFECCAPFLAQPLSQQRPHPPPMLHTSLSLSSQPGHRTQQAQKQALSSQLRPHSSQQHQRHQHQYYQHQRQLQHKHQSCKRAVRAWHMRSTCCASPCPHSSNGWRPRWLRAWGHSRGRWTHAWVRSSRGWGWSSGTWGRGLSESSVSTTTTASTPSPRRRILLPGLLACWPCRGLPRHGSQRVSLSGASTQQERRRSCCRTTAGWAKKERDVGAWL